MVWKKQLLPRRLEVLKTYKIYIGGQFPRTESGRYYIPVNAAGKKLANVCLSSRKDFRDAVVAARGAVSGWSGRAAFNRGQILYRMAEMLEGRKAQFIDELIQQDATKAKAEKEVNLAIDRLIYYAGWCDKFQQIFSAVNPVASSHFNFSVPEPTGVVSVIAPQNDSLLGLSFGHSPCYCRRKYLCCVSLGNKTTLCGDFCRSIEFIRPAGRSCQYFNRKGQRAGHLDGRSYGRQCNHLLRKRFFGTENDAGKIGPESKAYHFL